MQDTKKIGAIMPGVIQNVKAQPKQSPEQSPNSLAKQTENSREVSTEVVYTKEQVARLASTLGECLLTQRLYGRQAEDIKTVVKVFKKHLGKYDPDDVIKAIEKWLVTSTEFPTPSEIRDIIDPKPVFCAAYYSELLKKKRDPGDFLMDDEKRYLRYFQGHFTKGL